MLVNCVKPIAVFGGLIMLDGIRSAGRRPGRNYGRVGVSPPRQRSDPVTKTRGSMLYGAGHAQGDSGEGLSVPLRAGVGDRAGHARAGMAWYSWRATKSAAVTDDVAKVSWGGCRVVHSGNRGGRCGLLFRSSIGIHRTCRPFTSLVAAKRRRSIGG